MKKYLLILAVGLLSTAAVTAAMLSDGNTKVKKEKKMEKKKQCVKEKKSCFFS